MSKEFPTKTKNLSAIEGKMNKKSIETAKHGYQWRQQGLKRSEEAIAVTGAQKIGRGLGVKGLPKTTGVERGKHVAEGDRHPKKLQVELHP